MWLLSSFLPPSKDMHTRSIGDSNLPHRCGCECVCLCVCLSFLRWSCLSVCQFNLQIFQISSFKQTYKTYPLVPVCKTAVFLWTEYLWVLDCCLDKTRHPNTQVVICFLVTIIGCSSVSWLVCHPCSIWPSDCLYYKLHVALQQYCCLYKSERLIFWR